ncbi:MAG TPA: FkbM family methyltransferase [Chitinophagaceae bacterium]
MPATHITRKEPFIVHYRPGTADEEVLKESFEKDILFPGIPEYRVQPGHIIVDIGAHIGCFTLLAAKKVPQGKVYSFEPGAETYQVLEKNVQSNGFHHVKTFQLAVAAKNGKALLYHDTVTGNWGHSITKKLSAESEEVNCITLPDILRSENIDHVDFIKFNCEGAEFSIILNTSTEMLKRVKCILILYHGYLETNISKEQIAGHLKAAGFKIHFRFTNKEDDSGWMIAYQARFVENIFIELRTLPLRFSLFIKELKRKLRRAKQLLFSK